LSVAAISAVTSLAAYHIVKPESCAAVEECAAIHKDIPLQVNMFGAYGLGLLLFHELVSFSLSYKTNVQAMSVINDMHSWLLPSQLLIVTFSVLWATQLIIIFSPTAWY
ncbi:unnamed protein product, partial [Polarella glacialis]